MPTNISLGKLFVVKNGDDIRKIVDKADRRIEKYTDRFNDGRPLKTGKGILPRALGYFMQRMYFNRMEDSLRKKVNVDQNKCVKCGKCIDICPMNNLSISDGIVRGKGDCTLCYRCVHSCPINAISILGREKIQYKGVNRE